MNYDRMHTIEKDRLKVATYKICLEECKKFGVDSSDLAYWAATRIYQEKAFAILRGEGVSIEMKHVNNQLEILVRFSLNDVVNELPLKKF